MKRLMLAAVFALASVYANAEFSEKFSADAAKEVWNMECPIFDASIVIPDEVAAGQSAVIIAKQVYIDANKEVGFSQSKKYVLGTDVTNLTKLKRITRYMVKLLDAAGIEDFSEVELHGGQTVKFGTYEVARSENGFGARVHKSDGSIVDVDLSKALEVTAGKKADQEIGRKLAIPNLEVGDVLEYFTYDYDVVDEMSPRPIPSAIVEKYPIMTYEFVGVIDPEVTVEYRSMNGAPQMELINGVDGKMHMHTVITNLPAIGSTKYIRTMRQVPGYVVAVLNNTSKVIKTFPQARRPGVYPNLPHGLYFDEIKWMLRNTEPEEKLVKKTVSYINDWAKTHPEDNQRALIDRALIAMNYYYNNDQKITLDDMDLARTFREILRKAKLDDEQTGIGYVNPRTSVSSEEIIHPSQANFVVIAAGQPYLINPSGIWAPGEFDGNFQGEEGVVCYDDFNKTEGVVANTSTLKIPTSTFNRNVLYNQVTLDILVDSTDMPIMFKRNVKANAGMKPRVNIPVALGEWNVLAEKYLEIADKDRMKLNPSEMAEIVKARNTYLELETKNTIGVKPTIKAATVSGMGFLPKARSVSYEVTGTFGDLVTDAGDGELIVEIGRLFGNPSKLVEKDRMREYDAILDCPSQVVYAYTVNIPAGYKVDEVSVDALNVSAENPTGTFTAQAQLSEDGRSIEMNVIRRNNAYILPVDAWADYLVILDAAANYAESSIVLLPE